MKIALDARAYGWAGIGRYTRNLLVGLARAKTPHQFVVLASKEHNTEVRALLPDDRFEVATVEGSYYSWREQMVFWSQLRTIKADLFHFTHFNVPLFFNRPYVVTIHDTTRFVFPGQTQQTLMRQLVYERVFKHAVERSLGIVCVSRATRAALRELPFNLPSHVRVVHEAVEEDFTASDKDRERARLLLGFQGAFLLYVGVWMNHKNLPRLLAAYAEVVERYPRLRLVMTGRPRPGYVGVDRITRLLGLSSEQVVHLDFVPHSLLPALYAEASCLLLPSLYEGFGLPALEAARLGTPVVASHVTSLPEVLGKAASYVNPEYLPGIVAGIETVLADAGRRRDLSAQGQRRAAAFAWDTAAAETLAVYEAAI